MVLSRIYQVYQIIRHRLARISINKFINESIRYTHVHGRRQGGKRGACPPLKIEQALSYLAFYPKITTNRYGSVLRLQTCHASIRLTAVKTEINGFHVKLRASGSTQLHNAYLYSVVQRTLCGFTTLKTNVLSLCARIFSNIRFKN